MEVIADIVKISKPILFIQLTRSQRIMLCEQAHQWGAFHPNFTHLLWISHLPDHFSALLSEIFNREVAVLHIAFDNLFQDNRINLNPYLNDIGAPLVDHQQGILFETDQIFIFKRLYSNFNYISYTNVETYKLWILKQKQHRFSCQNLDIFTLWS